MIFKDGSNRFACSEYTIYVIETRLNSIRRFLLNDIHNRVLKERSYDIDDDRVYPIHLSFLILDYHFNATAIT